MNMLFTEKDSRLSPFIRFEGQALAAEGAIPKLSVLRVEMERVQPGMSDFIMRASTPKYGGVKSGTVLSIRGNRSFTKYDTVKVLATTIAKEMAAKKDATHGWADADVDHLADMLYSSVKYFAASPRIDQMRFTTEALA